MVRPSLLFLLWTLALANGLTLSHASSPRAALARPGSVAGPSPSRTLAVLDALRGGQQAGSTGVTLLSSATTSLTSMAKAYQNSLSQRPVFTKSLTAGVLFGLSDYLAQQVERRNGAAAAGRKPPPPRRIDVARMAASVAVGLLYYGPAAHYWYQWVFAILPSKSLVSTLQKAALGQLLFGPSFTCVYFGVGLAQAGQFTPRNWLAKIRRDLFGVWLAGAGFWPLVDIVSYSLVPQQYIPLFINLCSLVWTVYLSMLVNRPAKK